MSDLLGKRNEITYLEANKMDYLGKQNFLVRDPSNGHILFSPWFDTNMRVAIQCFHPINKLFVKVYRNNFPIAAPPFSADEYESPQLSADSIFSIPQHNGLFVIYLKSKGIYHIMADSNDVEGLTLFRFDDGYPQISQAYQMVAPLRYISSNDEFAKLAGSKNPKQDVDNFWITAAGGSKDRARELIRNYYTRIQDANRYFTSYQEGWKTDRGMIYLIFGMPNSIYRSSSGEVWTYGEERNYLALTFTFVKLDNPFSDNDYALQRAATYRNLWYNAVDLWREGRVY
jgi:GWxTD domain-containing protein